MNASILVVPELLAVVVVKAPIVVQKQVRNANHTLTFL